MDRLWAINECLKEHNADALIVSFLPNIRWLTGFSGSNGLVVYSNDHLHFFTDGRYTTQSHQEVTNAQVHIAASNLMMCAKETGVLDGVERIILEADHTTLATFGQYKECAPGVEWVPISQVLEKPIAIKTEEEKRYIAASQKVTDDVFKHLLGFVTPGMTEQEIAAEIVYQHLRRGASSMSFDPIVASGPNGALPHARPSNRELQMGDMVVVDMGCFVNGYASDMTRTFAVGEPGEEARTVYQTVLDAQLKALEAASPDLTTRELDHVARSVIEQAGYGAYFSHSLGHGVGLQIHEWPGVSWKSEHPLQEGMIITIEPGIYIPNQVGVRIEDMIQLTESGCENLTASPKALIVL